MCAGHSGAGTARVGGLRGAIGECLPRDHSLVLLYNVCSKRVTHLRNCPHFKTQLNCSSCLGVSDKCFHSFAVSPPALPRAACASWWGVARSSADDCSCLWLNLDRNVLSSALPPAATSSNRAGRLLFCQKEGGGAIASPHPFTYNPEIPIDFIALEICKILVGI